MLILMLDFDWGGVSKVRINGQQAISNRQISLIIQERILLERPFAGGRITMGNWQITLIIHKRKLLESSLTGGRITIGNSQ
jgi:hypothetical protein